MPKFDYSTIQSIVGHAAHRRALVVQWWNIHLVFPKLGGSGPTTACSNHESVEKSFVGHEILMFIIIDVISIKYLSSYISH
jgi:hypothetical protein